MGLMSALKAAFASGTKELNKEYGKTKDFLNAVCASTTLVIYADGIVEDSEKKAGMDVLTGHTQLSTLYSRADIEQAFNAAMAHGSTMSGKQELARALDKVLSLPNGAEMADDVYLMAADVASSNSRHEIGEKEQGVLDKLSNRLHVDPKKFQF